MAKNNESADIGESVRTYLAEEEIAEMRRKDAEELAKKKCRGSRGD